MDPVTTFVGLVAVLTPAAWALARLVAVDGASGTFFRYHPDLGWPRGVQEDDDVHWRWDRTDEITVRRGGNVSGGSVRPPAAPVNVAPLHLPVPVDAELPAEREAEIVDVGVAPVGVARIRRGR